MKFKAIFTSNNDIFQKKILFILAAAFGMILYTYLTPPVFRTDISTFPVFSSLDHDLPQYFWRFLMSFALLGILPFAAALFSGYRLKQLGFTKPKLSRPGLFWSLVVLCALAVGIISSFDKGASSFYPYSQAFPALMKQYGFWVLLIHPFCYFLFFYIPWEFTFRGILVFPFLDGKNDFLIACFQAIPSALLHFGHPFSETFSALFMGIGAAIVCVKTRSFLPALVFHAIVGITLDFILIFTASQGM